MGQSKRKQQTFEYAAMILLISTVLVKVIGAIFKIPLSNLIGDVGFGYFSSAYDLFTPIYTLSMAGLPIAVSKVVAENMAKNEYGNVKQALKVTKRLFFITGMTGFLLMLALVYPFVNLTDKSGNTLYSLFAIAPALLFCCIMSTYRGYYEGHRNMYPTAISNIIEAMGKLVLGYAFAYIAMRLTNNVAYSAAGAMLGITVGAAVSALYLRLYHRFKGDGISDTDLAERPALISNGKAMKTMIMIAIPIVLASLANSVASLVDVSMVKMQLNFLIKDNAEYFRNVYSSSIADYVGNKISNGVLADSDITNFLYGIRSKAFTIYNLIPTITSVLGVSSLPVLASSWIVKDKKLIKRNIESTIKLTAIIALPAGVGFLAVGGNAMSLLYRGVASVEIGGPMMRIYGIAAMFAGLAIPMTSMLQAIDKQVISLRNVAIGAALKVVVNFALVGTLAINIKGAAVGTAVCYMFIFFANLLSLIRYTKVVPNIYKTIIKPLLAAIGCGVTALGVVTLLGSSKTNTIFAILCGAAVYILLLIILNTFEEEDVLSLPKGEKLLKICLKTGIIRKKRQ